MREIRGSLEMPAAAALDELDAAALVMLRQGEERLLDLLVADVLRNFPDRQRLWRGKQGGFNRASQLVHHAAFFSRIGANASSCAMCSRPRRASSSAARKLEARHDRRNLGSWVAGRNVSRKVQSSAMPIILPTRSIASSRVM